MQLKVKEFKFNLFYANTSNNIIILRIELWSHSFVILYQKLISGPQITIKAGIITNETKTQLQQTSYNISNFLPHKQQM